ncbi:hypothetical protein EDD96_4690 [Streptomyces sp. Ag109_G2-6]|nr:hypothetical protein EDD96_4690 [Streptomyces sp. Ag109_G2-6]
MVVEVVSRTNALTDIRDELHDYPRATPPTGEAWACHSVRHGP